jgi:ribosomal protein L21
MNDFGVFTAFQLTTNKHSFVPRNIKSPGVKGRIKPNSRLYTQFTIPVPPGITSGATPRRIGGLSDYVIAHVSGRQHIFRKNRWYDLDYMKELNENDCIYLHKVLLLAQRGQFQLGTPFLKNIIVPLKFVQHFKKRKMFILKTKPKKHYTRLKGYRPKATRFYFPWSEMMTT